MSTVTKPRADWRLGPPEWHLDTTRSAAAPYALELTDGGWVERSRPGADKTTVRWREREKPGQPGVLERIYLNSEDRIGPVVEGCRVIDGSPRPVRARRAPASRTSPTKPAVAAPQIKRVTLTAWARSEFDKHDIDGLVESGGACYGYFDDGTGELVITDVTGKVYDAAEASAMLDLDWIDRLTERYEETGRELVGNWHSEPRYRDHRVIPSPEDFDCWRSWYHCYHERPFAGLILTPSSEDYGWINPRFAAFVANRDGEFDYVPVTVEPEEIPRWQR